MAGPALLLTVALAWPLLFSRDYFNEDWVEQLWFMWKQSQIIQANHLPSLFLNYRSGLFYPHYAFYGGTLYALTGALALALGDEPIAAYVLTYLLGFLAIYGGWYWLGRMFGLGRWSAQAPGVVFVTSPYYLTLIYARGDWPEFMGVSSIPLMVASGLSVLRADRLRFWPALALTASAILFFGSHSLTIVWGSTLVGLVGVAIVLCVPRARRAITRVGMLRVAGLMAPALLANAWFLLPALAYESGTHIASEFKLWQSILRETMQLVSTQHLFTLSRASASTPGASFALSLPILVIAWSLLSIAAIFRRGLRGTWVRVMLICATSTILVTVLMTHAELILALPRIYATLQFSYRLENYVLLGLSATVLAILVLNRGAGRKLQLWNWLLAPILLVSVVGAIQQAGAPPKRGDRYATLAIVERSDSVGGLGDYIDVHQPVFHQPLGKIDFAGPSIDSTHVSAVVHLRPGQLIYANLFAPPALVDVTGAKIVGIDEEGYDVLKIGAGARARTATPATTKTETVSVRPADPLPVALGRLLTLLGVCALTAQFTRLTIVSRRSRSGGESRARPA